MININLQKNYYDIIFFYRKRNVCFNLNFYKINEIDFFFN